MLRQTTPMKPGRGMKLERVSFGKYRYQPEPKAPATPATRKAVIAPVSREVRADPKPEPYRDRHLLDMAKGRPCLLLAPGIKMHDPTTSVACHQNEGKGMATKQDDSRSCVGCAPCHAWLDRSGAPRAQKRAAFMSAHLRQVLEWRRIAADASSPKRDRESARLALLNLNATPTGEMP